MENDDVREDEEYNQRNEERLGERNRSNHNEAN